MTPSGQHPITAARAPDLPGRQPGLDADRIDLYRHHRCLRALPRGTPQARQDLSGVPRTHQFLVTLTVHTNKINPAMTPSRRSATSMTNRHQVVVIQKDGQHRGPRTGLARRGSPRRSPRDQGSLGGSVRAGAGDHPGRRRGRGGRRGRWPATASTPQCGRPTPPARSINSRTRQMSTAMSMGGDPQLLIHTQVRYRGQRRAVSAERQRVSARPGRGSDHRSRPPDRASTLNNIHAIRTPYGVEVVRTRRIATPTTLAPNTVRSSMADRFQRVLAVYTCRG